MNKDFQKEADSLLTIIIQPSFNVFCFSSFLEKQLQYDAQNTKCFFIPAHYFGDHRHSNGFAWNLGDY
jgi:hypothetical protein